MSELDTRYTGIEAEGARQLAEAVFSNTSILRFSRIPLKEFRANEAVSLSLVDVGLGTTEGWVCLAAPF